MVWWASPTFADFVDFWGNLEFGTQKEKRPFMERTSPTTEAHLIKTWGVQTSLLHPYVDVYFRVLIKLGFSWIMPVLV